MTGKTKPLILMAGAPAAGAFLAKLSETIAANRAEVVLLPSGEPPSAFARWSEVDLLVAFAVPVTREDIARAGALRTIVVPSLGYESIDVQAASDHGIVVANGQVAENFESVAEAAILLMLMALYDVHAAEQRLRDGTPRSGPPNARMLRGKTVGIIGHGNIAREVIHRLTGWGVKIIVHRRTAADSGEVEFVSLDALLTRSDIIVPLLPLTGETRHLLDRRALLSVRPGAILINLSRGAIIDEAALADPAVAGRFKAIALDVFEAEPLPAHSPLRGLSNAILTSHEIAHTAENMDALFQRAATNVEDALAGRLPATALNAEDVHRQRCA